LARSFHTPLHPHAPLFSQRLYFAPVSYALLTLAL
jgi:hypothetical protein